MICQAAKLVFYRKYKQFGYIYTNSVYMGTKIVTNCIYNDARHGRKIQKHSDRVFN